MSNMFVCMLCRKEDKDFRTSNDKIGVALMKQHLVSDHDIAEDDPLLMLECSYND